MDGEDEEFYDVTVWNWQGDVVKRARKATFDEMEELCNQYGTDEGYTVNVEPVS